MARTHLQSWKLSAKEHVLLSAPCAMRCSWPASAGRYGPHHGCSNRDRAVQWTWPRAKDENQRPAFSHTLGPSFSLPAVRNRPENCTWQGNTTLCVEKYQPFEVGRPPPPGPTFFHCLNDATLLLSNHLKLFVLESHSASTETFRKGPVISHLQPTFGNLSRGLCFVF